VLASLHLSPVSECGNILHVLVCCRIEFGSEIAEICGLYNQMLPIITWLVWIVHVDYHVLALWLYVFVIIFSADKV